RRGMVSRWTLLAMAVWPSGGSGRRARPSAIGAAFAMAGDAAPYGDAVEAWQRIVEPVPDPARDVLERRHGEPFDLVKEAMVELVLHLGDHRVDLGEAGDPAIALIRVAAQIDFDHEGMAVHGRVGRHLMRRLESEFFE